MKKIMVPTVNNREFSLVILEEDELELVVGLFPKEEATFDPDWLKIICKGDYRKDIKPGVIKVSPDIHHVVYCDEDRESTSCPISFIVTEKQFILIKKNKLLTVDKILEWAKRGIIRKPLDLAQVIGVRILKDHQDWLENIEDQMEKLEEDILTNSDPKQQRGILNLQRKIIVIKKSLNRHLDAFLRLSTTEGEKISSISWRELIAQTQRELDNVRQAHELIESLREGYQAALDNRTNEVMKFLTLITTMLLPTSLLTGFFGMNFEYMPLSKNPYGVHVFLLLSISIVVAVILYFRKKGWLK